MRSHNKRMYAEGGAASARRLETSTTSRCYFFHCLPWMCTGISWIIVNKWWRQQELLGALNKSNRDSAEYNANKRQLSNPKQTRRAAKFVWIVNVKRVKIVHDTQNHTIPHSERYYLMLGQPTPLTLTNLCFSRFACPGPDAKGARRNITINRRMCA